ncbi:MAG: phytanoyl-CoA dioxygenase family protein [Chloroflexota bacterium]
MNQKKLHKPNYSPEDLVRLNETPPAHIAEFLNEPYTLAPEKIEEYLEKGHIKLEQVISGEPLRYYRELIGLAVGHFFKDDGRSLDEKRVYERSFLQAFNLWPHHKAIATFVQSFRFADLARQLMQVDGIRLWFDQALYKQPGGRITDYHVDAAYWPVHPAANTITIWMALVDVPIEKGCMAFASGSQNLSPDAEFIDIFNAQKEIELGDNVQTYEWEWVPLEAGDCTYHSGLLYHRAGGNQTTEMREAMTIVYMDHEAVYDWPESNPKAQYRHGFATEGIERGGVLNHPMSPRLL